MRGGLKRSGDGELAGTEDLGATGLLTDSRAHARMPYPMGRHIMG